MELAGPPRRVLLGPDLPRPPARPSRFRAYATPFGLLALIGLGLANGTYLMDTRDLSGPVAASLSAWAVLPVLVAIRRPLLAWRLAYPLTFLGVLSAAPREPWPWPPVQIFAFLAVVCLLAFQEETAVIAWITALNVIPVFLFSPWANAWGTAVLFVAIALAGDLVSRRRRSTAELARQSELTELEQARRAILEERTRIAREMHDVVAHHMSMIAVQAETAPYRVPGLPDPVRAEFTTIAAAAREALTDMRRLLGVLRAETEESPLTPQPSLANLPELIETTHRAGVPADLTMTEGTEVPEAAGLAAYRIVQEALANAARHTPGAPVHVTVHSGPEALELTIDNDPGPPSSNPPSTAPTSFAPPSTAPSTSAPSFTAPTSSAPPSTGPTSSAPPSTGPTSSAPSFAEPFSSGSGHGLVGMRERAGLLGGTLEAGPRPDGGYRVVAWLPLREGR